MLIYRLEGRPGWRGSLLLFGLMAMVLGLAAALTAFAIGAAIILIPVVLVASAVLYVARKLGLARDVAPRGPRTIEGDYCVVEPRRIAGDTPDAG